MQASGYFTCKHLVSLHAKHLASLHESICLVDMQASVWFTYKHMVSLHASICLVYMQAFE